MGPLQRIVLMADRRTNITPPSPHSAGFFFVIFQICLTDAPHLTGQFAGMDLSRMTIEEVQALLRLLAEWEREELELFMQERREAERRGRLH